MTRVAIVHPHFTYPGGASAVALETSLRLTRLGYDVHIVSLRHLPELTVGFGELKFHDLGGPLSDDFRYWAILPLIHRRFNRLLASLNVDVQLVHVFPANYWAFIYRMLNPAVPCVWYCHEPSAFVHDRAVISGIPWPMRTGALLANPILQVLDRGLSRYADVIVTNSQFSANRVRKVYGREAVVAYPGVDYRTFSPPDRKDRVVLAVGRLTRFKRFDLLLSAASLLKRDAQDVRWIIVGDGESGGELRSRAEALRVDDVVIFAGRLDKDALASLYQRALAVVVPGDREPFGIVPLEAMMNGTAVICSNSGGPTETVHHGQTGLHFRAGDSHDLARQVARLLQEPALAVSMGKAGHTHAAANFSWDKTTAVIEKALSFAIDRPARTRNDDTLRIEQ